MERLWIVLATLIAATTFDWLWRFWQRSEAAKRQQDASEVLKAHGLEAHSYLASFGAEKGELRDALSAFDFTNKIVLDQDGGLVGRVLPKTQQAGPGLRLVVDNTK